jgi:hypothetical protein
MKKLLAAYLLTTVLCGAASAETILSEDFEGTFPPSDWTHTTVEQSTTYKHGGLYSAKINASGDSLITPPLTNAQTMTFWSYTTSSDPVITIETSTSASGPWTEVTESPFSDNTEQWNQRTITLASTETLYVQFRRDNNVGSIYIDDVMADDELAENVAPVLAAIGDKAVVVSNELSFAVSATDANMDDIVLSATNLPSGAIFNTITNSGGSVSSTFIWTEAAPTGTYSVTFFANDGTTNASETITITVSEPPVLPDSVTFDFLDDTDLYGALDGQAGPVSYTNSELIATFTASTGTMNRAAGGFGLDPNDTDGFDVGESIDITFEIPVTLTNITVSSWSTIHGDEALIYVNGISNGVITSTGNHPFNIVVPTNQTLRIASTAGSVGNGWSLNSIIVRTDTNAPATPNFLPVLEAIESQTTIEDRTLTFSVSATDADGDDIILSATGLPAGAVFNTVTNAGAATNTFSWTGAVAGTYTPTFYADDGTVIVSETITITVHEQPLLLISEIADPAGTGIGGYLARFVELYNAGTNSIDLTGWTLSRQDNGETNDWTHLDLTGSIAPAGTYVIAYTTNFPAAYGFEPDVVDDVANGNGFDAYALYYNDLRVDLYGEINVNGDGTDWNYEDDRVGRNNLVLEPNTTFTLSEWTITTYAYTNECSPGIHGPTPEFVGLEDQEITLGDTLSLTVTATNVVYSNEVITLSATVLPGDATFPTAEGTGTVSSILSWTPTSTGYYTVTFAAEGIIDTTTESITVHVIAAEEPEITLTMPTGGPITLAWPTSAGNAFNVLTNADLTNPDGWGDANLSPMIDGDNYTVTNAIGSDPALFYKLESSE